MSKMTVLKCPDTGNIVCVPYKQHGPHKNWKVLGSHEGLPPEHATWVEGKGWVVDKELEARIKEEARITALTNLELYKELTQKIEDLERKLKEK